MKGKQRQQVMSTAVAMVLARVLLRVGAKLKDEDMMKRGETLKMRAEEALTQGCADLPRKN
jgi:hypothetical protein